MLSVQLHDFVHVAESVAISTNADESENLPEEYDDDCLACLLTIFTSESPDNITPFYYEENRDSFYTFDPNSLSAQAHFRLRAPPTQ